MTYVEDVQDRLIVEFPKLGEPHRQDLLDQYTLLALVKGEKVTPADVHDAWSVRMMRIRPEHWSIIPFVELTEDIQDRDAKYARAIQKIAREMRGRS